MKGVKIRATRGQFSDDADTVNTTDEDWDF
jgi:hypothetical protein